MVYRKISRAKSKPSPYTTRDHFIGMVYLRYAPKNLKATFLANFLQCSLAAPDLVSTTKCKEYLSCGSPTCVDCYLLTTIALEAFSPTKHPITYRRLPLLRLMVKCDSPSFSDLVLDSPRKEYIEPVPLKRGRKPKPSEDIIREASPIIKPPLLQPPEEPKAYKFLYRGKCSECGGKNKRIVAWDLCWSCNWKRLHRR